MIDYREERPAAPSIVAVTKLPILVMVLILVACASSPSPPPISTTPPTALPPSPTLSPTPQPANIPFDLISQESLFGYLEALTAIQPYSGWRNSASTGESEALDYVAATLETFAHLQSLGIEMERQHFNVFIEAEIHETCLHLTLDGQEVEVPADALRGSRDDVFLALRFDSDGSARDTDPNPVVAEGAVVLIDAPEQIYTLAPADLAGKIVFLDFAVIDTLVTGRGMDVVFADVTALLAMEPAGLVVVTRFSNVDGESHGQFIGDASILNWVYDAPLPPTLYTRLKDLEPFGIATWNDLAQIETARLTWDVDIIAPGDSENLVARIPGTDPSRAVIVSAHIDSPNNPGALDDGSGSAMLLEVARVIDTAQTQPPVDLYLVWYGGHEIGTYGSAHFVATHQELLDRTVAMLQIDCLTRPMDGNPADINIITWSYNDFGDDRLAWPHQLARHVAGENIAVRIVDNHDLASDNSNYAGFDVPHANLIYIDHDALMRRGSGYIHYAGHMHDPYDTVAVARDVGDVLEQMTHVALAAALGTRGEDLRATPPSGRRAVIAGNHTESASAITSQWISLGMALAWEGFDVDMLPYGQPLTATDLADADIVIVPPSVDYAGGGANHLSYDTNWTEEEADVLEDYVSRGGFLVLTNSAYEPSFRQSPITLNDDRRDVNVLAERFGITYRFGPFPAGNILWTESDHALMEGVRYMELYEGNGVPLGMEEGQILTQVGGQPAIGLVQFGDADGAVLVLADYGILHVHNAAHNLLFLQNLSRYAGAR
ncbi:MAG: M28 family peptidase [Anaerolineae bacterium]|nr:M28 family peptidase [Anaerolineae bacterium]